MDRSSPAELENRASDPSLAHLLGRLSVIEARVKAAVDRRRARDPNPDDKFRGLYISDQHVDRLLSQLEQAGPDENLTAEPSRKVEAAADAAEANGADLRLRRLQRTFRLDEVDVQLLIVALAPDLDPRFERLYGYLQDDVTRRRASVGLCLELVGAPPPSAMERERFAEGSVLVQSGLILVEDANRPFLTRSVRIPDRLTSHLLGHNQPDPLLEPLVISSMPLDVGNTEAVARGLQAGVGFYYVRERAGGSAGSLGAAALARLGLGALSLDLQRLAAHSELDQLAQVAIREARLLNVGLIVGPIDGILANGGNAIRTLAEAAWPVIIFGSCSWDPLWSRRVPLLLEAPPVSPGVRAAIWKGLLDGSASPDLDPDAVTAHFKLSPDQLSRAATAAHLQAVTEDRPISTTDLWAGARSQNAAGLERLARRVEPVVEWNDLVLPANTMQQLREIVGRARHHEQVIGSWGVGGRARSRMSITALFAGPPGTGKTMAAEVVAHQLGLDLYTINLATVIDKYIGETEKNLERIFVEAERINGVLFFDEADALFGRRSEVKDARDRYANVEVAYLLQRVETFKGVALLATNLKANVDEAFARRLDAIIEFPSPDPDSRKRLWEQCLGPTVPRAPDIDIAFLAQSFELTGGDIRNIAVAAAFEAADAGRPVEMVDLVRATEREYLKLGRLVVESEFGPYYSLVRGS